MSDGTVLFDNASISCAILHPDASGNYADGTWTPATPGTWYSLYSPDAVLSDGTWMKYGGEYNPGNESAAEIYNPANGAWTIAISPISSNVYDTFNAVLANGMVLNSSLYSPAQVEEYNWQTCSWSALATAPNWGDEANVELLPDGDVFDPMWSQQYSPSLNSWINLPAGPVSDDGDPGPAIQLYNGEVLVENTQNQSMFYIPSNTPGVAGTWSPTVVTLPTNDTQTDYQSSIEPNGNVLLGANGNVYELNTTTNVVTQSGTGMTGWYGDIITLPNGQLLVNNGGNNSWVYTPTGGPNASWRPTVTSVTGSGPSAVGSAKYTLTGTQLFGLSQCSSDNDDGNSSENYPIVSLKSGSNVWYCRTYSYSTRSIAPGSAPETCQFSVPASLKAGKYSLYVTVNGISSASAYTFTAPATVTPPAPGLLSGQEYVFTPSSNGTVALNSYSGGATVGQSPIDCTNSVNNDDYFTLTKNSNGTYTITDDGGLVLDGNGLLAPGGPVIENNNYSNTHQEWNITSLGGGLYEITNDYSGLALDAGTNPVNLQTIVNDPYTGAAGQKWNLFDGSVNGFIVTYQPGLIPDWNAGNTGIPQQVDLLQNSSISFPVSVLSNTANGGSVGTVTFSVSGLPSGVTASFSPTSVTGAGKTTCTLRAGASAAPGIYTVDITGTGSGVSAGIIEGQDMHVNMFGSSLANGVYSPVNAGQMNWSQWPAYITIDDYGGNGPLISQVLQYTNVNQQWTVTQEGSTYKLIDGAGLALTATSATSLTQTAYTGSANQLWTLSPNGLGFLIKSEQYGSVLDMLTNGYIQPIALDTPSGASSQSWIFTSNTSD